MRWPWSKNAEEPEWTWPDDDSHDTSASETRYVGPGQLYDGSNFFDGVGGAVDEIANLDYWTLRARSAALFYGNLYARGIIRRMVTDVINTGLQPESTPEEGVLGLMDDALEEWAENIETIWRLYGESKDIVDYKVTREEGELQAQIYTEALVEGDCLVINRIHKQTGLPQLQIVNGGRVRTPIDKGMDSSVIDGVRIDKKTGRHVGYYVYNGTTDVYDDTYTYIPAVGSKSGRRVAWMVYGPDKREDGIRGEPLLGIAIQPLKEIHDFRGSVQLKEKLNAQIVLAVERTGPVKTKFATGGAMKKGSVSGDTTGGTPTVPLVQLAPGMILQGLEPGEKLTVHSPGGTSAGFGPFESAIMVGLAWGLQIPPEILMMSFNKAYSASQAAKNKWNTYLAKERSRISAAHCKNHYEEWFVSSVLSGKIVAAGFLDAMADSKQYDVRRAWLKTEWYGQVEPTVDPVKHVTSSKMAVAEALSTRTREARQFNGSKFSHNARRIAKENEALAAAMRPLLDIQNEYGSDAVDALLNHSDLLSAIAGGRMEEIES
jgi:lambda family phage portal protein